MKNLEIILTLVESLPNILATLKEHITSIPFAFLLTVKLNVTIEEKKEITIKNKKRKSMKKRRKQS